MQYADCVVANRRLKFPDAILKQLLYKGLLHLSKGLICTKPVVFMTLFS